MAQITRIYTHRGFMQCWWWCWVYWRMATSLPVWLPVLLMLTLQEPNTRRSSRESSPSWMYASTHPPYSSISNLGNSSHAFHTGSKLRLYLAEKSDQVSKGILSIFLFCSLKWFHCLLFSATMSTTGRGIRVSVLALSFKACPYPFKQTYLSASTKASLTRCTN